MRLTVTEQNINFRQITKRFIRPNLGTQDWKITCYRPAYGSIYFVFLFTNNNNNYFPLGGRIWTDPPLRDHPIHERSRLQIILQVDPVAFVPFLKFLTDHVDLFGIIMVSFRLYFQNSHFEWFLKSKNFLFRKCK